MTPRFSAAFGKHRIFWSYALTVCAILVPGIGGLTLNFGAITLTAIATALILGIAVIQIFGAKESKPQV